MSERKQTMTMNADGKLLTSCDTLFPAYTLPSDNLKDQFPFLDSVFSKLIEELEIGNAVLFPKVATKHPFLSGYYDYRFRLIRIYNDQMGIQWEVIDATKKYEALKEQQQSEHEDNISNQ